jgi:hypothetical protein
MRFATWQLFWEPDARYGSGPETQIDGEGILFLGSDVHDAILGYVHSDHNLIGLENWNVQEVTSAEALALAQSVNEHATMTDEGRIVWPPVSNS